MSKINNGGPAFPVDVPGHKIEIGMNLRDHFAAKAMQGYLTHEQAANSTEDVVAGWAYSMADAMLRARGEA